MSLPTLLRSWFRGRIARPKRPCRCGQRKPVVEVLEDRTLLDATLSPINGSSSPTAVYLGALYSVLLQRPAQPSDINSWVGPVAAGMMRSQAVEAILNSTEYKTNLIAGDYQSLLGRAPDPSGQAALLAFFQSGGSQEQLTAALLASQEFYANHGSNPVTWLAAVYQSELGRAPEPAALAGGLQLLNSGVSQVAVALAIVTSSEADARFVQTVYSQYLARQPASAEGSGWVGQMQQGMTQAQVITQIASADEFFQDQFDSAQIKVALPSLGTLSVTESNGISSGTLTQANGQAIAVTGNAWFPRVGEVDMTLTESPGTYLYVAGLANGTVYGFVNGGSASPVQGTVILHPKETASLTATISGWSISLADANGQTNGTLQQSGQPAMTFAGLSLYLPDLGKATDGGSSAIFGTDFTLRTLATITSGTWAGRTLLLTASNDGAISLEIFAPAGLDLQGSARVQITGGNGVATTASIAGTIGGYTLTASEPNNASTDGGAAQNWTTGTLQPTGGTAVQFQGNNLFLPNPWPFLSTPTELVSAGTITTGPWSSFPYLLDASSVSGTVTMQVFSGTYLNLQGLGSVTINL